MLLLDGSRSEAEPDRSPADARVRPEQAPPCYSGRELRFAQGGAINPFLPGDEAFVAGLEAAGATLTHKTWAGEHTGEDWDSHWRSYLGFYADALLTLES